MTDDDEPTAGDGGLSAEDQRAAVRERYAKIATDSTTCCDGDDASGCCDDGTDSDEQSRTVGYSSDELDAVESGANLGLGCGNPTGIASLEDGDTVLDLGSGAGFDCFLAAQAVGSTGRVIGVDMTPEMIEKARENRKKNDETAVEFRLGEIEHLPVADDSVDVIISNCVINLSPDKPQVFREAFRVLRPGGRLAVSDVVLTAPVPASVRTDPTSVASCVAGASPVPELEAMLADAGFTSISIETDADSESFISDWDDERDLSEYIVSATIEGRKPAN
jgi:SAM-dependent methyltransferase